MSKAATTLADGSTSFNAQCKPPIPLKNSMALIGSRRFDCLSDPSEGAIGPFRTLNVHLYV